MQFCLAVALFDAERRSVALNVPAEQIDGQTGCAVRN
jgi:hypothetical protein